MVTGEALVGVGWVVCLFKCLFGLAGAAGRRGLVGLSRPLVVGSVLVGWCWLVCWCSVFGVGCWSACGGVRGVCSDGLDTAEVCAVGLS